MNDDLQTGVAAGVFAFCVLYAVWPQPWKWLWLRRERVAYLVGVVMFFVGMFALVQWSVCFMIYQISVNSGYTPDYTPESCVIDTTLERFK